MMTVKDGGRLLCLERPADDGFWDRHWRAHAPSPGRQSGAGSWVVSITDRHLPAGSRILEGGAGSGRNVSALQDAGYRAIGVDFAPETVRRVKAALPEIDLREADVRSLPFPDGYFDGYWSVGVIEHFFEGYETIASEMRRVLRPGGVLFISFPYISPLRRLKMAAGLYPLWSDRDAGDFYQFLLDADAVESRLRGLGFSPRRRIPFDAVKGLKDECPWLKGPLQAIYDSRSMPVRALRKLLDAALYLFSSHCILLVMEKD